MGNRRVQVIGGGFAGLAAAYFLARAGFQVRLVEEKGQFGGLLQTVPTAFGLVETAANALLSNALVEETAAELGIELVPTLPSARRRYIFRRGQPRRWPLSGPGTFRFLGSTVPRFVANRPSFRPAKGESVLAWGYRNLGKEATDYLLVPGLSGVYAGSPEKLSATLILSRFLGSGRRPARGRLRGSVAPRQGMGEWAKAFAVWLERHGAVLADQAEEGLPTVVALPPHRAADFLRDRAPALAAKLAEVEMLSLVSVTCFLPDASPSISGFGCLFPRSEGIRPLGVLANSSIFPDRALPGWRSETWIFGGAADPAAIHLTDQHLLNGIYEARAALHGREGGLIEHYRVSRWPNAIPHYSLALEEKNFASEGNYTPFGTYLGDLGLARVLLRAQELARNFE